MSTAPIVITGATGFLGRALLRRLRSDGRRCRVLVRRAPSWLADDSGVEVVSGDLDDAQAVRTAIAGATLVYHLGATITGAPAEIHRGTAGGTRHVVDACLAERVTRLVYVSSLTVLAHAGRPAATAISEHSPLEPFPERRGAYTQAKLLAERAVIDAIGSGLHAVIIRPGKVIGPGAEYVAPNATVEVAGRWIAVGPGTQKLPLVYIDDVVDALVIAGCRPGIEGATFHVVDSTPVTLAEYLAAARGAVGARPVIPVPRPLFLALAAILEAAGAIVGRDVPLTRYRARSLTPLSHFDLSAATDRLGWRPRVGIRAGLQRTFPSAMADSRA